MNPTKQTCWNNTTLNLKDEANSETDSFAYYSTIYIVNYLR